MTTENAVSSAMTRRDVLKGAAALSAAGVAASALPLTHAVAAEEVTDAEGNLTVPSFLVKPEPITEFAETVDYDVVVVGAGEAGLSAIHTALEAGATVACLQNTSIPFTTGNMAACIDLEKTDEAAIQACLSMINWKSDFRSNRALVEMWARTGQEALAWWEQAGAEGGFESQPYDYSISYNHYDMFFHANTYFHLEGAHNDPAQVIAEQEAAAGCVFYYDTPAVQLKVEEDGSVSGAIGQREDGTYILVNAAKGVILCTGDYTGNLEMRDYYCPDAKGFQAGVALRDGSGFAMGMWAGAQLTGVNHTKMIHGEGAPVRLEMPFLFLDTKGRRFMDENCGGRMGYLNNYQRAMLAENGYENVYSAKVWSIVPSNWADYVEEWQAANPYEISVHNAYRDVDPSQWVTADTFEGLAEAMNAYAEANEWGIEPVDVRDCRRQHHPLRGAVREGRRRGLRQGPDVSRSHGRAALLRRAPWQHPYLGHPLRPRVRRQRPVLQHLLGAHSWPLCRGQRLGPVLRRCRLPDEHRRPLHRSRNRERLLRGPLRGEPLG